MLNEIVKKMQNLHREYRNPEFVQKQVLLVNNKVLEIYDFKTGF